MQSGLTKLDGVINDEYRIIDRKPKYGQHNNFYFVRRQNGGQDLLLLKNYLTEQGCRIETRVWGMNNIFGNYLVNSMRNFPYKNELIHYAVVEYSPENSIYEFIHDYSALPINVARSFLRTLLQQLSIIKQELQIVHPQLLIYDLILRSFDRLVISGWSKDKQSSEREIIINCAEIFFSMITQGELPGKRPNSNNYDQKKLQKYFKYDKSSKNKPKNTILATIQRKQFSIIMVEFIMRCVLQQELTFEVILHHPFLNEEPVLSLAQIRQVMTNQKNQAQSKRKRDFDKQMQRRKNIQMALYEESEENTGNRTFDYFPQIYYQCKDEIQSASSYKKESSLNSSFPNNQIFPEKMTLKFTKSADSNLIYNKEEVEHEERDMKTNYLRVNQMKEIQQRIPLKKAQSSKKQQPINKVAFVMAWIKSYLKQNQQKSLGFLEGFVKFGDYQVNYEGKSSKMINYSINLYFEEDLLDQLNEEEDQASSKLLSIGMLIKFPEKLEKKNINEIIFDFPICGCSEFYQKKLERIIWRQIEYALLQ